MPRALQRCFWAGEDPLMVAYHDEEWGVPIHDDRRWYEKLTLDGAQAGGPLQQRPHATTKATHALGPALPARAGALLEPLALPGRHDDAALDLHHRFVTVVGGDDVGRDGHASA